MYKLIFYLVFVLVACLLLAGQAPAQQAPEPPAPQPSQPPASQPPASPPGQGTDSNDDENSFFDEPEVIVPPEQQPEQNIQQQMERQTVNFTGNLNAAFNYSLARDFVFNKRGFEANTYSSSISGDLLLDIRLLQGIKAFGALGLAYAPAVFTNFSPFAGIEPVTAGPAAGTSNVIQTLLKELFIDANINHALFLRAGKQVLIWGRAFFWNPTDLLNRQRKNFFNLKLLREGIYGLKMQIPFGTAFNLYGFIDATGATALSGFALAGRAEFLFLTTALAFSGWYKDGFKPVYGFDFSTNLLSTELYGELSLSYGDNRPKLDPLTGKSSNLENTWVPRVVLGLRRNFELLHVVDRVRLIGELYYNYAGYTENVFAGRNASLLQRFITDFYEPNEYGRFYSALFINIAPFVVRTMSLHLNTIGNWSDLSFTGITGVDYQPVDNFTLTADLISFWGENNREYTAGGNALTFSLGAAINF